MKQLFSITAHGYLFWRISRTATLKHCIGHYGRYFSALKAVQKIHQDMFSKPVVDSKKLSKNIYLARRFSLDDSSSAHLMDFDVWSHPKILQIFRDIYYYFVLKDLSSFSVSEFVNCSVKALQVVTVLLAQRRFEELEGLLTPECQKEVEKNLKGWSKVEALALAFKSEDLMRSIPCDINIFSGEEKKEKTFVEIRVIYYVWLPYSPKFQMKELQPLFNRAAIEAYRKKRKLYVGAVYNCKFIKEITSGVEDQWTINKINLKCFPAVYTFGLV